MAEMGIDARTMADIGLGLAAGFVLAQAYLAALAANVRLYLAPGGAWRPIGLHVARLAGVVAGFTVAASFGAPALIAMLAGFTLARALGLRRHR